MVMIAYVVNSVLQLYTLVIFVTVVMSWLISFNVINRHNGVVDAIWRACVALTEPLLRPIRNMLPNLGGLDVSPIVLLIAIGAARAGLNAYVFAPSIGAGL
ncbi:MAG: YggT family protein [Parvularculaceae bacterium]